MKMWPNPQPSGLFLLKFKAMIKLMRLYHYNRRQVEHPGRRAQAKWVLSNQSKLQIPPTRFPFPRYILETRLKVNFQLINQSNLLKNLKHFKDKTPVKVKKWQEMYQFKWLTEDLNRDIYFDWNCSKNKMTLKNNELVCTYHPWKSYVMTLMKSKVSDMVFTS